MASAAPSTTGILDHGTPYLLAVESRSVAVEGGDSEQQMTVLVLT